MSPLHAAALVRCALFLTIGIAVASWPTSPAAAADPPGRSVVCLDGTAEFGAVIGNTHVQSMWKRELMRQALLLAARAELNLATCDSILGEDLVDSEASLALSCEGGNVNRIELVKGPPGQRKPVWSYEFKDESAWPPHKAWVSRMESLSRNQFVEALKKANYSAQPAPRSDDAEKPLDADLTRMIDEDLSFLGQFLALRRLHQGIATGGETSSRRAGLIRAYAHLGLLTEYQWHPMSYAFKARALLYAQRWAVREPKSKPALLHRAYAFALVGMHGDALADLQAAAKLPDDAQGKFESPAWIPLIDHYCRYDFEQLNKLRTDEHLKPLASLLYFLAYEQEGSNNLIVTTGLELIKEMPGCYRMLDTLCHHTGPGAGHVTTQVGPAHLASTLLPRLAAVQELPQPVRSALDEAKTAGAILTKDSKPQDALLEIEHRAKVMAALRKPQPAPDGSSASAAPEPGWTVLAQIIDETSYLHVFHRAFFVRTQLGFPVDDYLEAYKPVVEHHRYAAFLDVYSSQLDPQKFQADIKGFYLNNNDYTQARLWVRWPQESYRAAQRAAMIHLEGLPNEQGLAGRLYPFAVNVGVGPLLAVSPHSPYAMALALRVARDQQPAAEKSWEETAQRSPYLALAFAEVWMKRGNLANAEKFLKLAASLDPSPENYQKLAKHYKDQGDDQNWLKALEDCLKTPSLGLQHAQIQCEIAQYYSSRREWDKALPYADAAGQTGAQWAMTWARMINEANQNWEAAERHYVAAIGRYGENPIEWYLFCKRNGVGNLAAAREAAFPEGVEAFAAIPDLPVNYACLALLLEAKPSKALEIYEKQCVSLPSSFPALQVATIADRVGESSKRDKFLKQVVEQKAVAQHPYDHRPHREELVGLARHLIADLAAGGKCKFDFDKLHAIRDKASERDRCSFNYFLACYLDRHGQPKLAVEYWKQCMGAPEMLIGTRNLAGAELSKRGVEPKEWKPLVFGKPKETK